MNRPLSSISRRSLSLGLACFAALSGCNRASSDDASSSASNPNSNTNAAAPTPAAPTPAAPAAPPQSITNRFGMTFRLVSVDPKPADAPAPKFGLTYPTASYYYAERPLTEDQFKTFQQSAAERDRNQPSERRKFYEYPDKWDDAHNFGVELSALDPDYDYRLPTREEYVFACLNGYDQDCPVADVAKFPWTIKRPNKFGLEDLTNGSDVEIGNLQGLHFGLLTEQSTPDDRTCPCAHYGYGNPEGDDGFEGICQPRYILTPKVK